MPATTTSLSRGTDATRVYLRVDRFDHLCAERGATTVVAQAALLGVDRGTIYRLRRGVIGPSGPLMMHTAALLGVAVEELWERRPPRPTPPPPPPKPPAGPHTPKPPAGPRVDGMESA